MTKSGKRAGLSAFSLSNHSSRSFTPRGQVQVPLLPELISLAGIVVASNIAYLRMNRFRYQDAVRGYAEGKLKEIAAVRDKTPSMEKSKSFKALRNLAEKPSGKAWSRNKVWSWLYTVLLRSKFDRRIAWAFAGIGLIAIFLGNAHAVGQFESTMPWFDAERISVSMWILMASCIQSLVFVVLGEAIVDGTRRYIDEHTSEMMNLMPERTTVATFGGGADGNGPLPASQ